MSNEEGTTVSEEQDATMPTEEGAAMPAEEGAATPEGQGSGMSTTTKILIGALAAIVLIACCAISAVWLIDYFGQPEPTAVPPTAGVLPTAAVPVVDDSWERVQAAGKIVVGTSADYPPFEYFVDGTRIDGFDIALMDEIGRRLGVAVDYGNFAFDGLGPALRLQQIDVAIAAISVTSEREGLVDFSNVYLVGQDAWLAQAGSSISIGSAGDLGQYRIGVQRGSVYENWLETELVNTGMLPADNLFAYEQAEHAVRDLVEGRLDLVVLDALPADVFASAGGVEVIGGGLNQQRYAVALPKGAQALKAEIDRVLSDLHNEGVIAQLAKQYLDLDQLLPTPTPGPTSTPGSPPACVDGLTFVEHVTRGGERKPGEAFTKVWKVLNSGTCTWDTGYRVVYVSGNDPAAGMGGQPTNILGQVAPGQTYDVAVDLVAPLKPGDYQAYWQMENSQPLAFGERLPVAASVPALSTATPAPTQTPHPSIIFTVDRDHIRSGECVTFYWKVENVKAVYFYAEGEDWRDHGVAGEGSQVECPPVTTTYNLRVVNLDDSVDTRQITIYVEAAPDAPQITRFTVDPPNQITLGECVTIRWTVEGAVSEVSVTANGNVLWDPAPTKGNIQDCPGAPGTVTYDLVAVGPGGTSQASETINVVGLATATPAPTAAPDQPVIYSFAVTPDQVAVGDCVNISWSTGGGTSWVTILRGEATVLDNAPLTGSVQDCPAAAGVVEYAVLAYNVVDDSVIERQPVTVTEAE